MHYYVRHADPCIQTINSLLDFDEDDITGIIVFQIVDLNASRAMIYVQAYNIFLVNPKHIAVEELYLVL